MRTLSPLDRLLDATVLLSFDAHGAARHARRYDPGDLAVDLAGRRVAITGANSGIGKATAAALAALGAEVLLLCRSPERGEAARAELVAATGNPQLRVEQVDVSSFDSVRALAQRLRDQPLHCLIHNAGVLPSERSLTPEGHELTLATNLLGPALLTQELLPALAAAPRPRLLFVTSGGMYPTRLSLMDFEHARPPFDGVKAYSRTKRALVVLTEQLAERMPGATVHVMHPGWADTPAVASSLPGFHSVTERILRSPEQGADTLVWLAAAEEPTRSTGALWFDRRAVATHYLPWTRASEETRQALFRRVCAECGLDPQTALRLPEAP